MVTGPCASGFDLNIILKHERRRSKEGAVVVLLQKVRATLPFSARLFLRSRAALSSGR